MQKHLVPQEDDRIEGMRDTGITTIILSKLMCLMTLTKD